MRFAGAPGFFEDTNTKNKNERFKIMRFAIKSKYLIDGKSDSAKENTIVLVDDGLITDIIPQTENVPKGYKIIGGSKISLLPGFIDTHIHILLSGGHTLFPWDVNITDAELLLTAARNSIRLLKTGVTTARDCGGRNLLTIDVKDAIEKKIIPGPKLDLSIMPITATGGHVWYWGLEVEGVDNLRKTVRYLCGKKADFIKVMATGGGSTLESNVLTEQYTLEELKVIAFEAHNRGRRVTAHAHSTGGINLVVDAGFDSIEHCSFRYQKGKGPEPDVGVKFDQKVAEKIAKNNVYVSLTGTSGALLPEMIKTYSPERQETMYARVEIIRKLKDIGVKMTASTDQGVNSSEWNDLPLHVEALVRTVGFSPSEAIKMATSISAECMGKADIGSIEPGKKADLIMIEGNPFENIKNIHNVKTVLIDGEIVFDKEAIPGLYTVLP